MFCVSTEPEPSTPDDAVGEERLFVRGPVFKKIETMPFVALNAQLFFNGRCWCRKTSRGYSWTESCGFDEPAVHSDAQSNYSNIPHMGEPSTNQPLARKVGKRATFSYCSLILAR